MTSDLSGELTRVQDAVARTAANLLALEEDPTVQLLDAAALSGETAVRWREVTAARAALFRAHHELSDAVARASHGRPSAVVDLLRGPSVVRVDVTRPLAERGLLDASRRVERGTPDELLGDMSATFAGIRAVVTAVERGWAEATEWVRHCRERLDELTVQAAALETVLPPGLDGVARELDAVAEDAVSDPLAWPPDPGLIESRLADAELDLATLCSVTADWPDQLAGARQLIAELDDARTQADALAALAVSRISDAADASPVSASPIELEAELDDLAARVGTAPWSDLAAGLVAWRHRTHDVLAAVRQQGADRQALLDARDELRGRLDAYHAKAGRLNRLEDLDASQLYRRAREALYTAPTDLARAGELVRQYQTALGSGGRS